MQRETAVEMPARRAETISCGRVLSQAEFRRITAFRLQQKVRLTGKRGGGNDEVKLDEELQAKRHKYGEGLAGRWDCF